MTTHGRIGHSLGRLAPVLLVAVLVAPGCRSTGSKSATAGDRQKSPSWLPGDWGDDKPRQGHPERLVVTWTDAVLQRPGEPAKRGFGGRVYFYDRRPDPIAVQGRLVVYAFDESGRTPTDHKPTRRYVFPADQLASHQSSSEIGPSYSFWLPWGDAGGPEARVSLIARFEPTEGGNLIVGEQATQLLPGGPGLAPASPTMIAQGPPAESSVRPAAYARTTLPAATGTATPPAQSSDQPQRGLSTTTIKRPR